MTIRKGKPWGSPGRLPADGIMVSSDAEARAVVEQARRAGRPIPPLGLLGGDLCATLGGTGDTTRIGSKDAMTFPVDVCRVVLDGRTHWFVAHLIARRSWWWGRLVAVMNAQWLGNWDLGPRSHPNDGRVDVSDCTLSSADRLKARRRLPTGSHLPHPGIVTRRTAAFDTTFDPSLDVYLDGERVGRMAALEVEVEPDALTVVV